MFRRRPVLVFLCVVIFALFLTSLLTPVKTSAATISPVDNDADVYYNSQGEPFNTSEHDSADFTFVSPFSIYDSATQESYVTSSTPCGNDNMFLCTGSGNTYHEGSYWYWPSSTGSAITSSPTNNCPSALVLAIPKNGAHGLLDAHLSIVNPTASGLSTSGDGVNCGVAADTTGNVAVGDTEGKGSGIAATNADTRSFGVINSDQVVVTHLESENTSDQTLFNSLATLFAWTGVDSNGNGTISSIPNSVSENIVSTTSSVYKNIEAGLNLPNTSASAKSYATGYNYYTSSQCTENSNVEAFLAVPINGDNTEVTILHREDGGGALFPDKPLAPFVDNWYPTNSTTDQSESGNDGGAKQQSCLWGGTDIVDSPARLWEGSPGDSMLGMADVQVLTGGNGTAGGAGSGSGTETTTSVSSAPGVDCSVTIFNPLSWLLCPLAVTFQDLASSLDNEIASNLSITTGPGSTLQNFLVTWEVVRDLSLGLIVIAALVAVIAQSLGFELLDAYAIRKALPRIIITAIGISLSWPLMNIIINITNNLGTGVRELIYSTVAASGHYHVAFGGGGTFVAGILAGSAIAALSFAGVLSFAATAALAASVAFLVLIIRQMLIVLLVIFSPIALVCYVLPNTQRVWKLWADSFVKGLLMFPLIMAFIALGHVFSAISSQGTNPVSQIIAFAAYFAPYFLLPFTFRLAGGALSTIGGFVNDRHRGAFDGLKNFRGNRSKQRRANAANRARSGNVFRKAPETGVRASLNRGVQTASLLNQAGYNPKYMAGNIAGARSKLALAHLGKAGEHSDAFNAFSGNDDMLEAAQLAARGNISDARKHLVGKGYEGAALNESLGLIQQAKQDLGAETLAVASAVANGGTGTGNPKGAGQMLDSILKASGGNMTVATAAYAQARSKAEGARRFDLLGGGFGQGLQLMQRINAAQSDGERAQMIEEANDQSADMAIETQGIGVVVGGRGQSGKNLAPAMQRRMQSSTNAMLAAQEIAQRPDASEVQVKQAEDAERLWIQNMASTSAAIDMSGSAAPEIQRLLANDVHNGLIPVEALEKMRPELRSVLAREVLPDGSVSSRVGPITMSDAMTKLESMPAFGQMKKVYSQQYQDQAGRGGGSLPGAPGGGTTAGPTIGPKL